MPQIALTATPTDVSDELSLMENDTRLLQAYTSDSNDTPVYLAQSATAPTIPDYLLSHLEDVTLKYTGTAIWAWTPVGRKRGSLLVSETF